MRSTLSVAGAVLVGLLATLPAQARNAAGELRCTVMGGFGLFVASSRKVTCVYYRPDGRVEFYVGSAGRIGLDIGATNALRVAYRVIAPVPEPLGALEGDYAGPGVEITAGSGIGANALTGHGVTFLPLANENVTGLNFSGGLGILHLRYAGMEPSR